MRLKILIIILIVTIIGSGYWYHIFGVPCAQPLRYSIGTIDERFNTNADDVMRMVAEAEAVWEAPMGKNLFQYDPTSEFTISFVFDDRQERAEAEAHLREDLDAKEGMSAELAQQYEEIIKRFRTMQDGYERDVVDYEISLKAYNERVAALNAEGGATPEEYATLKKEEDTLSRTQTQLQVKAQQLNDIVAELNRIGARGNAIVTDYNTIVEKYNTTFTGGEEFTQGDYHQTGISIYQFDSEEELIIVLAHELGHFLGLDHTEYPQSIMYRAMGEQSLRLGATEDDLREMERVCAPPSILSFI